MYVCTLVHNLLMIFFEIAGLVEAVSVWGLKRCILTGIWSCRHGSGIQRSILLQLKIQAGHVITHRMQRP